MTYRTNPDTNVDEEDYEFIELLSPATGTCTIQLSEYSLLRDGNKTVWTGAPSASIKKGKRYVIAGKAFSSANTNFDTGVQQAAFPQGGGCIELQRNGSTVDALCYGTPPGGGKGEGPAAPAPAAGESIARIPDGADTDQNSDDFKAASPPTPKTSND
jgi:hypothetical protein